MTAELFLGDCLGPDGLLALGADSVDIGIHDPPYSAHVHKSVRTSASKSGQRKADGMRIGITVDLGFDSLKEADRNALAAQYARITRRWTLIFSDSESAHLWAESGTKMGLQYIRTLFWHKVGGCCQFTGDRPAVAVEAITLLHRPGKKRWNGGGKQGFYPVPIVHGSNPDRMHPTQKPLDLMLQLVRDFSDPGELIMDSHSGSGTTAIAALRTGRSFIGWERMPEYCSNARRRIADELSQPSLFQPAKRVEQLSLG